MIPSPVRFALLALQCLLLIATQLGPITLVDAIELNADNLGIFCSEKKLSQEQIVFKSPDEVKKLIKYYEKQLAKVSKDGNGDDPLAATLLRCRDVYGPSIQSLKEILHNTQLMGDVCSLEAYKLIRQFHLTYIHYYKPELSRKELVSISKRLNGPGVFASAAALVTRSGGSSDNRAEEEAASELKPIAPSLRQFFVLFVKQINSACKQKLVNKFNELVEQKRYVGDREFAMLKTYKHEARRLMPLGLNLMTRDTSSKRFKSLEVFNFDLDDAEKRQAAEQRQSVRVEVKTGHEPTADEQQDQDDDAADDGRKLYIQVKFHDNLKRISDVCKRKFQPVYDEFFAPVIRLNNLGYIDNVKSVAEEFQLDEEEKFTRWFSVINACEILKDVEVLHDPTFMSAFVDLIKSQSTYLAKGQDTTELNRVKVLSKREADQLKARSLGPDVMPANEEEQVVVERAPVKFAPRMWLTEPKEIAAEYKSFDAKLNQLIGKRISVMRHIEHTVSLYLKSFIQKHRREIEENDRSTTLGRLSSFCARHNFAIKTVMIVIAITLIVVHAAAG